MHFIFIPKLNFLIKKSLRLESFPRNLGVFSIFYLIKILHLAKNILCIITNLFFTKRPLNINYMQLIRTLDIIIMFKACMFVSLFPAFRFSFYLNFLGILFISTRANK